MLGWLLHAPRGPFYSPKTARSRWRHSWKTILAFCRVAHWTVWCTTGHPLFIVRCRSPSIPGAADRWIFGLVGAPDSPVTPADRWRGPRVAHGLRGRRLRWRPLAHRTVRWIIVVRRRRIPESGQFARAQLGAPDTVRCTTGQSGVPDCAESWLLQPTLFLFLFSLILALR
jgi:hypothetical protein